MTGQNWVKEVRKSLIDKDVSITDMASALGITTAYVYMAYKGESSQETVDRISEYCGIDTIKVSKLKGEK